MLHDSDDRIHAAMAPAADHPILSRVVQDRELCQAVQDQVVVDSNRRALCAPCQRQRCPDHHRDDKSHPGLCALSWRALHQRGQVHVRHQSHCGRDPCGRGKGMSSALPRRRLRPWRGLCCNDGTRPVIFRLERIDVPENDAEEKWRSEQKFANSADDAYTGL